MMVHAVEPSFFRMPEGRDCQILLKPLQIKYFGTSDCLTCRSFLGFVQICSNKTVTNLKSSILQLLILCMWCCSVSAMRIGECWYNVGTDQWRLFRLKLTRVEIWERQILAASESCIWLLYGLRIGCWGVDIGDLRYVTKRRDDVCFKTVYAHGSRWSRIELYGNVS